MTTKAQALLASINTTQLLDPLLLDLAEVGNRLHTLTQGINDAHAASQLTSAQIDAQEPLVVEKIVEVLPPNFLDVKAWYDADGVLQGAKGDGVTDDTEIVQRAIDTAAKLDMVCWFSSGTYLIDPRKMLLARSSSWLQFHPDALLKAMPNDAQRTNVLYLDDVTDVWILGIRIWGDRMEHDYSQPGTEEWGHGIKINNNCCRIVIRGFDIRRCHGDGLSISAKDVYLYRGISTQNRRQGLTIGSARSMRVVECEFSETKALTVDGVTNPGTAPQAGIDIEPDKFPANDIYILRCKIRNNGTAGVLQWVRSEVGVDLTNILLEGNIIEGNPNQIQSKALVGTVQYRAIGNFIRYTTGSGIRLEAGTIATIGGSPNMPEDYNTFQKADGARTDFILEGRDTRTTADIRVITPSTPDQVPALVTAKWNNYK